MNNQTVTLLLRLIHILGGIFWVGAMFLMAGFLLPTVRATGREGGRFMQHLMQQRKLPVYLAAAMLLTVLSGLTLYGRLIAATHGAWAGTPPGIAYGVGGLAAILGAGLGMAISGTAARRMAAIGQSAAQGAAPSPEQQSEIAGLQTRMILGSRIAASLLLIAAAAMAIARYL
jgi:uncharacterized membrane protein